MLFLKGRAARIRLGSFIFVLVLLASCASPETGPLNAEESAAPAFGSVKLLPPEGSDFSRFGHSVATDGESVLVGAWGQSAESGAAYVYRRVSGGWELSTLLVADDATEGARFGYSLDIEGETIAVGAIYDPTNGHAAGAVYLFERTGGDWVQTAKLLPAGDASDSHFGRSVSLDGDRLAVGAPGPGASQVHTYVRSSAGWHHEASIEADTEGVRFGTSLALDDGTLAVGAWTEERMANGYVALYQLSSGAWTEVQRVVSDEPGSRFGYSVGLSGNLLAVGAPDAREAPMLHLYEGSGESWSEVPAVILEGHSGELGHAVALYERSMLAGDPAFASLSDHAGQVLLTGDGSAASLLPDDPAEGNSFGVSVAAGGRLIVVGATGDDSSGPAAGAAYIFNQVGP